MSKSSQHVENSDYGEPYILTGKNGSIWKLHCADDVDLMSLPEVATPAQRLEMLTSAVGFVPTFSGIASIDFISIPLTQESADTKEATPTNGIWCYCVKCGHRLASEFSRMALQFVVGFHKMDHWEEERPVVTYYPRLLCHKCDLPKPTYTEFPLVPRCFTVLDEFLFGAIREYQEREPLNTIIKKTKEKAKKTMRKKRKRLSQYCHMCGKKGKAPYCCSQCRQYHELMVNWKRDLLGQENVKDDDKCVAPKELALVPRKVDIDLVKLCEDYIKGMLDFFKIKGVNVNEALADNECNNLLCPRKRNHKRARCTKRCTKCNRAMYCGKECQLQHWRYGHNRSCIHWKQVWSTKTFQPLFL